MKPLQLAVASALAALYIGLAWVLSSILPILGWFLAPALVMIGGGFLYYLLERAFPVPWDNPRTAGPPPRAVHLSWIVWVLGLAGSGQNTAR